MENRRWSVLARFVDGEGWAKAIVEAEDEERAKKVALERLERSRPEAKFEVVSVRPVRASRTTGARMIILEETEETIIDKIRKRLMLKKEKTSSEEKESDARA